MKRPFTLKRWSVWSMKWVPSQGSWVWPSPDLILFFLSRQTLDLSVERSKLMDQIRPSTSRYFATSCEISWKIKMQCFIIRTLFRWTRTSEAKHLEDKQLRFVFWPPPWSWRWWESRPDWAGRSPSCRLWCTASHAPPADTKCLSRSRRMSFFLREENNVWHFSNGIITTVALKHIFL